MTSFKIQVLLSGGGFLLSPTLSSLFILCQHFNPFRALATCPNGHGNHFDNYSYSYSLFSYAFLPYSFLLIHYSLFILSQPIFDKFLLTDHPPIIRDCMYPRWVSS